MSYEAWGDDDDGMDGFREHYRKQLIEDGWLDDVAAAALRAERDALAAKFATPPESLTQPQPVDAMMEYDKMDAIIEERQATQPEPAGGGDWPPMDGAKTPWEFFNPAPPESGGQGEAVAWAIELPDGTISPFGWCRMDLFAAAEKLLVMNEGCRFVFAYYPSLAQGGGNER